MNMNSELGSLFGWVEDVRRKVHEIVEDWRDEEGNLIMILHAIQNQFGYIPRGVANELSRELGISMARIYEVLTFYHYFRLTPPGRHKVQVCMGTACYLKGAMSLQESLQKQLRLLEASGAPAGEYEIETVRCIGCCGMAPAVVMDGETHGRLTADDTDNMLKRKRGA